MQTGTPPDESGSGVAVFGALRVNRFGDCPEAKKK